MNISRRQLYAAGETLGGAVTRLEGGRLILGGGGGGSNNGYYANQDKLLGVQADIATNMYNQYADYAPGYLNNSQAMVTEAMDGSLESRLRGRAAADSTAANAQQQAAVSRNLASMGVNPNDPRFAGGLRTAALQGAAQKASAMNGATMAAEDQKWNRNANAYGQIAGMGAGAMQGLSSAAGGYGQMAGQMQSANNAAMQGYGQFGAAVGSQMFKADGGYIDDSEGQHFAAGGFAMPKLGDWRERPTQVPTGNGFGLGQAATAIAAPVAMQAAGKLAGKGLEAGTKAGLKAFQNSSFMTQPAAPVADAVGQKVGEQVAQQAGEQLAEKGAEQLAEKGAEAAAGSIPGAGQVLGVGTNLAQGDYVGAALNAIPGVGSWLDAGKDILFAASGGAIENGGLRVERRDFQVGGPVQGPGGPTEDAIPAWLSNGEHVQNATSTQLAGVDVLDQINQIGLMVREGQLDPDRAVQMIGELMKSRGEEMAEGHPGANDSPAEERAERKKTAAQRKAQPSKAKNFKSTKPMKPAKMELKEGKR